MLPWTMRQPGTPLPTPKRSPWGVSKPPLTSRLAAVGGGEREEESGSTARVAAAAPNEPPAVIRTGVTADTGKVTMGKVAVLKPGRTATEAGTSAVAGLLLVRLMAAPLGPAGCARITCPSASRP